MPALPTARPSAYFAGARFTLSRQTCACDGDEEPDSPVLRIMPHPQPSFRGVYSSRARASINGQRSFTRQASANQGAEYGDSRYNGALFKRAQLTGFPPSIEPSLVGMRVRSLGPTEPS